MKTRSRIIALSIFLFLLVYVLITQTGNRGFDTLKLPQWPKWTAEEIETITIQKPPQTIRMEKTPQGWNLTDPLKFPVEKTRMDSLTRALAELRITSLVTERGELAADYGLTTGNAVTLVMTAGKKSLTVEFGDANPDATQTFVRIPGQVKIYQVLGNLASPLRTPVEDWRSLTVFDFSPDLVQEVTITASGQPELHLVKTEEISEPIVKDTPQGVTPPALPTRIVWKASGRPETLADAKVNAFLNTFTRLRAITIVELKEWTKKPLAVIRVHTRDNDMLLEILEFKEPDKRYRIRRGGESGEVYEIYEYQGKSLIKRWNDFL